MGDVFWEIREHRHSGQPQVFSRAAAGIQPCDRDTVDSASAAICQRAGLKEWGWAGWSELFVLAKKSGLTSGNREILKGIQQCHNVPTHSLVSFIRCMCFECVTCQALFQAFAAHQ